MTQQLCCSVWRLFTGCTNPRSAIHCNVLDSHTISFLKTRTLKSVIPWNLLSILPRKKYQKNYFTTKTQYFRCPQQAAYSWLHYLYSSSLISTKMPTLHSEQITVPGCFQKNSKDYANVVKKQKQTCSRFLAKFLLISSSLLLRSSFRNRWHFKISSLASRSVKRSLYKTKYSVKTKIGCKSYGCTSSK